MAWERPLVKIVIVGLVLAIAMFLLGGLIWSVLGFLVTAFLTICSVMWANGTRGTLIGALIFSVPGVMLSLLLWFIFASFHKKWEWPGPNAGRNLGTLGLLITFVLAVALPFVFGMKAVSSNTMVVSSPMQQTLKVQDVPNVVAQTSSQGRTWQKDSVVLTTDWAKLQVTSPEVIGGMALSNQASRIYFHAWSAENYGSKYKGFNPNTWQYVRAKVASLQPQPVIGTAQAEQKRLLDQYGISFDLSAGNILNPTREVQEILDAK